MWTSARAARSATSRRGWKSAVRQTGNSWTAWCAAEKIIYDHVSTGAADDLVKATDIARAIVARYGMDEDLGHVSYDTDRPGFLGKGDQSSWLNRRYSAATAERMDAKVRDIVEGVFKRARTLLKTNLDLLDQSAQDRLQRATLDETDLVQLVPRRKERKRSLRETVTGADDRRTTLTG